jgi:hypothetical protein
MTSFLNRLPFYIYVLTQFKNYSIFYWLYTDNILLIARHRAAV